MACPFRITLRLRRLAWRTFALCGVLIVSATFGDAHGLVSEGPLQTSGFDLRDLLLCISFLFALTCIALATLGIRLRLMQRILRKIALHNEALADRNWELQEAEQRVRSLFESQGDLIVLRDADGLITFANDAYCTLAGKWREELIGSRFAFEVLEQGEATVDSAGTRVYDQKIAGPLGPRWIAWREGLARNDATGPAEVQSVGRDVTERTEGQHALAEARDHADAASRAKSRFLAMVSHEIRTPLNGIIGMSGLLIDTQLTPEQMTYAKAVKTSGDALLSLIEELLDYAKVEAGKIDLQQRPFGLAQLIEDITELLAPKAEAKGIEIAAYVDERLPLQVVGDASRLRQVLLNLAGNAVKFTSSGGVALIVEPGDQPDDIRFMVRDTGIGIAAEARQRIFREFEQADERVARSYGGTGLGLSISDRIVQRMGGRIALASTVGAGSTFEVSIPLAAADPDNMDLFAAPDLSGLSVMLVVQQDIESELIARRLQRWGAQTCLLSDVEAAQLLLPEQSWHALLMDHTLGAPAIKALSEAARPHAAQRIVMFTPATRQEFLAALAGAVTGYLVKPLRAASLATRLTATADVAAPLPAVEAGPEQAAAPQDARSGDEFSILVAEDNEINALLVRSLLTRLGHKSVITTDGEEALKSWLSAKAAGTPYDLVLMDVQMPRLNGIETTKRIRNLEAGEPGHRTHILALTANTLLEDRYACFEAGMDGFLLKPLDREKLEEALAALAASRNLAA